jgi:hypothetical protein
MRTLDQIYSYGPCPMCDSPTDWDPDCPGWQNWNGVVMVCQGCGNADRYWCTNESCDWWYRDPVGIRSDVAKMGVRPSWLKEDQE